ncbi:acyl carrier protein, partial [Burkholderia pseudomallei]|uniref:acyl carrier protein n=1 Tax=Burkholderia pseudomallei TaxID=28450 RepID=UPI0012B74248
LMRSLADALFVDIAEIDVDRPFAQIGMDSIVGVEWIKGINQRYRVALKATDVYDHPTIASIAALVDARGASAASTASTASTASPEADVRLAADARIASAASGAPESEPARAAHPGAAASRARADVAPDAGPAPRRLDAAAPDAQAARAEPVPERIAIVGMSGRYPGAPDLDAFWDNLAAGRDAIAEIPPSRWPVGAFYDPEPGKPGKVYCTRIGLLDDVDR